MKDNNFKIEMDYVYKHYLKKLNDKTVLNENKYRGWNKYTVKVINRFMKANSNNRKENSMIIWDYPIMWGLQFERLKIKNMPKIHMKPMLHGDVAFGSLNISGLLVGNNAIKKRREQVEKISSSIKMWNDNLVVGCDNPPAILASVYLTLKYLLGHLRLSEAVDMYAKLVADVVNEDKYKGDFKAPSKKLTLAVVCSLNRLCEKYSLSSRKLTNTMKRTHQLFPSLNNTVYSFNLSPMKKLKKKKFIKNGTFDKNKLLREGDLDIKENLQISSHGEDYGIKKKENIVTTVNNLSELSDLVKLLKKAKLVDALEDLNNITVFAPTNDAFKKIKPVMDVFKLGKNKNEIKTLRQILLYHISPQKLKVSSMENLNVISTLDGESIEVKIDGDSVSLNDSSKISKKNRDFIASNGILHVIDNVLLPKELRDVKEKKKLAKKAKEKKEKKDDKLKIIKSDFTENNIKNADVDTLNKIVKALNDIVFNGATILLPLKKNEDDKKITSLRKALSDISKVKDKMTIDEAEAETLNIWVTLVNLNEKNDKLELIENLNDDSQVAKLRGELKKLIGKNEKPILPLEEDEDETTEDDDDEE